MAPIISEKISRRSPWSRPIRVTERAPAIEYTSQDVAEPTCLDGEMPRDGVLVKADWRRVLAGENLPIYDTSAWKAVTDARFGNSGRNSIRGPGAKNVDLSVFRLFPVGARAKIEGRMEIFNLFNWPVFNNPGQTTGVATGQSSVTSRDFMRITSSLQYLDRQIRFALRVAF